jgi:TRAP transporter TAXI family solute receptor
MDEAGARRVALVRPAGSSFPDTEQMPAPLLSNGRRIAFALVLVVGALAIFLRWEENAPVTLVLGAGTADSESFQMARAIAEVVQRHHPRIRIIVAETQGSQINADLLGSGELDMATIQADMRTPPRARLIAPLYHDAFQLIAVQGSGIRSPGDLRGKIVALPPEGSGGFISFWELAGHYGLTESDLRALPMSREAATWAMATGAVDGIFRSLPAGSRSIRELMDQVDAYLVPIEQAAAMRLRRPALESGFVPRGSYLGEPPRPPSDLPTATVTTLLTASEDLDGAVAHAITTILFERRRELMELAPMAGFTSYPDEGTGTFLPVHEGAQRYYNRERPNFLQENAELIALILSIGALAVSSLFRVADQGRRKRLEAYNAEILALYSGVRDEEDRARVAARKDEMLEVLIRVLDDAEEGRVTEEGFQVFSLTWQAVYGALRDRLVLGPSAPPTHGDGGAREPSEGGGAE